MGSGKEICLICLKNNYEDKILILFDLTTLEWENVTYLNKLEYILNAEIMVFDSTLICSECLNDLNNAFNFKERAARALEYWTLKCDESVAADDKPFEETVTLHEEDNAELNNYVAEKTTEMCADNNEINEPANTEALNNDNTSDMYECTAFSCTKCNCVFPTASELIHHDCDTSETNKVVYDGPPKAKKCLKKQKSVTYECELCQLQFTKRWLLNKHVRAHTEDKKYVCTFCNRAFKQSYHLREHTTSHTGEHNFKCSVCGKTFQRMSSQRRHMRTHEALPGEKAKKSPFLCNICGKRFPYSNGAQRHMRIHTNERRYECKICNRKFSQSTHLKVHLRTHTGERPYMCSICGDSFSIKASLHKHMRAHDNPKNDIKILQNLEPNLSQTDARNNDGEIKTDDFVIEELPLYEQGYLITYNQ